MSKIPRIINNTRVSETNGLTLQLTEAFVKDEWNTDSYLQNLFSRIKTSNQKLGEAIKRDKTESELAELDDLTDKAVTNLHGLTKGYTFHPDKAIYTSANKLLKLIDKYGLEVKAKSYLEEYPLLNSLITDSRAGEYADCIAALPGCDIRFTELETSVNTFTDKQNEFNKAKDSEQNLASASVIKKELLKIINDELVLYLNAMRQANSQTYSTLADYIGNRINQSNVAVNNRSTNN
nr:DUF6261 family protein [uncultured Carboxylicivirga sp.]